MEAVTEAVAEADDQRTGQKAADRVFQINHGQYWVASSLNEALEAAEKEWGVPRGELIDEWQPPRELSSSELHETMLTKFGATRSMATHMRSDRESKPAGAFLLAVTA